MVMVAIVVLVDQVVVAEIMVLLTKVGMVDMDMSAAEDMAVILVLMVPVALLLVMAVTAVMVILL